MNVGEDWTPIDPARSQRMLQVALAAARWRRARRVAKSGVAACVLTLGILGLVRLQIHRSGMEASSPLNNLRRISGTVPSTFLPDMPAVAFITTDPRDRQRMEIVPVARQWVYISDSQLLQELAAAGHPAGLVEMNGKERLLERNGPNGAAF